MRQTKMRFKKYIIIFLIQKIIQKHVPIIFTNQQKTKQKNTYKQIISTYQTNIFFKTRKVLKRNVISKNNR